MEVLTKYKEELERLEKVQKENDEAGAISKFKKGDFYTQYKDIEKRIHHLREKIAILEINNG